MKSIKTLIPFFLFMLLTAVAFVSKASSADEPQNLDSVSVFFSFPYTAHF